MAYGIGNPETIDRPAVPRLSGKHWLIYGHRRFRALAVAGEKEVTASIYPAGTPLETLLYLNVSENTVRRPLSDHDIAAWFVMMRSQFGTSARLFAEHTGITESKIETLAWIYERLPVDVLENWKREDPYSPGAFFGASREWTE